MSGYTGGERVNITINDAVVLDTGNDRIVVKYVSSSDEETGREAWHQLTVSALTSAAVTIEHVAPAEWPPQIADVWRDKDGDRWFTAVADDGVVIMRCSADGMQPKTPDHLRKTYGPLNLAFRDEASGEESPS